MSKVISIHEYELKPGVSGRQFEAALENARQQDLFDLPGLIGYRFLRRLRGTRPAAYAAIWIYEDRSAWAGLWGQVESPIEKEAHPPQWKVWEDQLLAPLLDRDPHRIDHAAYEEI